MKQKTNQAYLKFIRASHVREKQSITTFVFLSDMKRENENYLTV